MVKHRSSLTLALAAAVSACSFGAALAGDNNTLRVIQNNLTGGPGNSLYVDQSAASNSLVLGPDSDLVAGVGNLSGELNSDDTNQLSLDLLTSQADNPDSIASQKGSGNSASITMTGDGGEVQLLQDNSSSGVFGNTATIVAGANTLGAVLQIGDKNIAALDIRANGKGLIAQNGNSNNGTLNVESGGTGKLVQNGNGNFYPVSVNQNTNVTVVQNGNDLQPVGVAGMQVFSTNPGTITITQTGF